MPISAQSFDEHSERWCAKLGASRSPYRRFWPNYLFRHEHISNATAILRSGQLRSRNAAAGFVDIAAQDVVARTTRAHPFARLYFRPNTPTQYRVEGIKKPDEVWHGAHAAVLVMFVFHAKSVLTRAGVRFSDGNMQSHLSEEGENEEFFLNSINFDDVYHASSFSPENRDRIMHARCAEVLAPSPLDVREHLSAIVCRSAAERTYFLESIGDELANEFGRRIVSFTEPGIFVSKWAYVDSVEASDSGLRIRFHSRADNQPCDFRVEIFRDERSVRTAGMDGADLTKIWLVRCELAAGRYRCVITLDGVTAYDAHHLIDNLPF